MGTCNTRTNAGGTHCGTQVIRFEVRNREAAIKPLTGDTTSADPECIAAFPTRFRAANPGLRSLRAPRVGSTIAYRLSERARVKFRVERVLTGRRLRGRCVKPSRSSRHPPREVHTLQAARGSLTHTGRPGTNRLKFQGRVKQRRQEPGRYRLRAVAKDLAGNASRPTRARFRLVRR